MRSVLWSVVLSALALVIVYGCTSNPDVTDVNSETISEPPAVSAVETPEPEENVSPPEAPPVIGDLSGEIQFLTAEDMQKLREERGEAIERNSPLNEEVDEVGVLEPGATR